MDLNDPSRVATINYVLSKSAPLLRIGDQVRLGMEGDPCSVYKGSEAASIGIVTHLEKNQDGSIEFTAGFSDGAVMRLNSYDVRPERVWERLGKFGSAQESEGEEAAAEEPIAATMFPAAAPAPTVELEQTAGKQADEPKDGNDEKFAKDEAYEDRGTREKMECKLEELFKMECDMREKMCKLEEIVGTLCDRVSETEASCRTTLMGLNHHAEVQKVLLGHIAHALVLAAKGVESPTMRKILDVFDQLYAYTDECRGVPSLEEASEQVERTHRAVDDEEDENDVRKFGGKPVLKTEFTNTRPVV
jgi:hypothetical protein